MTTIPTAFSRVLSHHCSQSHLPPLPALFQQPPFVTPTPLTQHLEWLFYNLIKPHGALFQNLSLFLFVQKSVPRTQPPWSLNVWQKVPHSHVPLLCSLLSVPQLPVLQYLSHIPALGLLFPFLLSPISFSLHFSVSVIKH